MMMDARVQRTPGIIPPRSMCIAKQDVWKSQLYCRVQRTSIETAVVERELYETNRDFDSQYGNDGFGGCSGPAGGPGLRGPTAGHCSGTSARHVYFAGIAGACSTRRRTRRHGTRSGGDGRNSGRRSGVRYLWRYSRSLERIFNRQVETSSSPARAAFFSAVRGFPVGPKRKLLKNSW
jgi:hypothetical protein